MIYFVQAGDTGPIKIGHVEHPFLMEQRLGGLQTGNAERLYVLASLPGDLQRERALHRQFHQGQLVGEWFRRDTPGLQRVIYDAVQAEALLLVQPNSRYCSWCKIRVVSPPRRSICSEDCEQKKKRSTAAHWRANNKTQDSPRGSEKTLQTGVFMETAGIEPAQRSPRDGS